MFNRLGSFAKGRIYWLAMIALCIALEAAALIYQYVLDYYPCVLCIHVRIWVFGMLLLSVAALFLRQDRFGLLTTHVVMTGLLVGLAERSYMLLGTERHFVMGSCEMTAGLPSWFALEEWFPLMFKVWEACGYTPVLLFGITMAEALMVMSVGLLLLSLALVAVVVKAKFIQHADL